VSDEVCGVGIKTSHHAIVCNQCKFYGNTWVGWFEKNSFVKVEGGKDFLCF